MQRFLHLCADMIAFDDSQVFIFSAVLAMTIAAIVNADCDIRSATGLFLTGHEYLSFPEEDFQQCYKKCKADEPKCRSLNYHTAQKRCDLNNATRTLHPEDVMKNPLSLYFESRHRVSFGSQRSVAGKTCKEILSEEESAGDGFYWLNSNGTEDPYVTFCNMSNGGDSSSSFDVIFHDRNTTNFVELDIPSPDLSAFTVCFWFRAWERQLVFLSYATKSFTDAIMMFLSSTGVFRFLVLDEQIHGQTGTYDDKAWHHLCGKWANKDGVAKLFVDGECKLTGDRSIHGVIPASGKFIIGQDQDMIGGAFDREQSFVGEISHLYLWSVDLEDSVISILSMRCKEYPHPGYIVGWPDFTQGLHGNVTRRNNSRCVTKQNIPHKQERYRRQC